MPKAVSEPVSALRAWFRGRRRDLPWRVPIAGDSGLRDPYRTWVSEIMLQQTRVETVIPYFEAFLQRFPHVEDLAYAPLEDVLQAWSGLGYYRRARFLQAAARHLMEQEGGRFPETADGLQALPGIGPYTSAAIASLAFGERRPVVDGNVKRVVARWAGLELAADDPALERASRAQGEVWMEELPAGEACAAGELNEALMELGATTCLPRNPGCGDCPLVAGCAAHASGREEALPLPKRKKEFVDLEMVYLVLRVGVRVLMGPREDGWSPGLYEPPSLRLQGRSPSAALQDLQAHCGVQASEPVGSVRHTITHHRIRAQVHLARPESEVATASGAWVDPAQVPLTGMAKKVLRITGNQA